MCIRDRLAPDAKYDVIFVVLRYTQLDSALDTLRANRTRNIVFVGNNVQARALAAALPGKNVLFAFALSAGHREADRVVSIDLKKITIGQLPGAISNKQLIGRIFHGTKYKVVYEPNMEDYLLCHAEMCIRDSHMILSISLPTAKRVVVSHHLVVAHAWHTTPETRLILDV